jgi:hypothetical protein
MGTTQSGKYKGITSTLQGGAGKRVMKGVMVTEIDKEGSVWEV